MIHSIIFIGTLVAVFFYASVVTIEKTVPKVEVVAPKVEIEAAPIDEAPVTNPEENKDSIESVKKE